MTDKQHNMPQTSLLLILLHLYISVFLSLYTQLTWEFPNEQLYYIDKILKSIAKEETFRKHCAIIPTIYSYLRAAQLLWSLHY